jgi:hypothetical protein
MTYKEAIQNIDTRKALTWLGLQQSSDGNYLKFTHQCGGTAAIKPYGDKKNLWYCEGCKSGGNIIALAGKLKGLEFQEAKNLLLEKADSAQPLGEPLKLDYDLEYHPTLKEKGIPEEATRVLEVGRPKGKTMLSGCLAFAVRNEKGFKVAYYGIKPDGTPKFHSSFNPETLLYIPVPLDYKKEVILTGDMIKCLVYTYDGKQSCCNFGLPYISKWQMEQLKKCERLAIDFSFDQREIIYATTKLRCWLRFLD